VTLFRFVAAAAVTAGQDSRPISQWSGVFNPWTKIADSSWSDGPTVRKFGGRCPQVAPTWISLRMCHYASDKCTL